MNDDKQDQIIQEQIQANERMLSQNDYPTVAHNQVPENERLKQLEANERLDDTQDTASEQSED